MGAREQACAASSRCPQRQIRVAFFPFVPICLKALRPLPYAREPKTLGEHLKKRRYELDLRQKDVADKLEIGHSTYITWETDQAEPEIRYWPKIIDFLGRDPFANRGALSERGFKPGTGNWVSPGNGPPLASGSTRAPCSGTNAANGAQENGMPG